MPFEEVKNLINELEAQDKTYDVQRKLRILHDIQTLYLNLEDTEDLILVDKIETRIQTLSDKI